MSKLERINNGSGELWGYRFECPGCEDSHAIPTVGPQAWGFNGDVDKPTLSPSILVHETKRTDGTTFSPRCHSFVRDGRIEFLGDCGHKLAGQTIDLPPVAADVAEGGA